MPSQAPPDRARAAEANDGPQALRRRPRALLFDLDGTLYAQRPLRALMAFELLPLGLRPGWAELKALRAFREVREELREGDPSRGEPLERRQYERAAAAAGCDPAWLERLVEEWMYRRPLKYLRACRRPGVLQLLAELGRAGVAAGVLSDFPVTEKLRALGLAGLFSPALCTVDREIDAFKPDPRGFLHACALWGLRPDEVLYVGDRREVDGLGARNAGMDCWIVSWEPASSFGRLARLMRADG